MRSYWITSLEKIAFPVLDAAAMNTLKATMPIFKGRDESQYLEAVGRIICGIAPWLNLPDDDTEENKLRERYRVLAVKAIGHLVNPDALDYVDFGKQAQALVDTAYLTQGLLKAPGLWDALGHDVQKKVLIEVKKTRQYVPARNNWLLFASMVEAFLQEYDHQCIKKRLYDGVNTFINKYYIGDGLYGDGAHFAIDHYNSYVIHPMLVDILEIMKKHNFKHAYNFQMKHWPRYKRYIEIQERLISPEGTYPLFGRTLICRFGTFHALAQAAFLQMLPKQIYPAQVRCALHAVLKRHMEFGNNFDAQGFLTVGFNGAQEDMAESYVSSGSSYHCCSIFLPLGLHQEHPFWSDDNQAWTSVKAFNGLEFDADKTYYENHVPQNKMMYLVYRGQSAWSKFKKLLN